VVREEAEGDVLVFLPGAAEIRKAGEAIAELARERDLLVLPLHGDLTLAEQARAVGPASRRKVLLSTNVAETSVTIDGVTAVIDSGLARIAGHSSWSGLPTLSLGKISKASAIQRAGRAGRTRPGRALRLYPREDFEARPAQDAPEIRRLDLSQAVLLLRGAGVEDPAALAWLDAPPAPALEAAELLLRRLGAVDPALTNTGKRMLSLPLHPRLARLCVEGESRGVANQAALVAALLGERDARARGARGQGPSGPSDLTELGERLERVAARRQTAAAVGLEPGAAARVIRVAEQLGRSLRDSAPRPRGPAAWEEALGLAVLAAFPDRVARRRAPRSRELVLCEGGSAQLAEDSVVTEAPFLCAVDVEERTGAGRAGRLVRFASAVEPEWLLERSEYLAERDALVWNATDARVDRVTALAYGAVVLEESRSIAEPSADTTRVLADAALARGADAFDLEAARATVCRIALCAQHFPDAALPTLGPEASREVLLSACEGLRSFAELRAIAPGPRLLGSLTSAQQALVARHAPERLTLPNGRGAQVHYDADRPPWIESRLQDFFGLAEGPRICAGRVPLVLHLLAPNGRAVQVTQDLAGFWQRHYPAIRRELGRRYPRHSWPEDGSTAAPTPPRGR
jgi:ATP-dependent helicase HrpB